jgi:hypothetical protein
MNSITWWSGPLVLIALRLIAVEAGLAHAETREGTLIFRGGRALRFVIGGAIVGFSVLVAKGMGREETWVLLGGAAFPILGCFAWPSTIVISPNGIQRHVWWRRTANIPWNQVGAIAKSATGYIEVVGKNGQCISFTPRHVDPWRFLAEVKQRSKLTEVIDSSAPPTLRL